MQTVRFYPFVFTSTDEGGIAAYYNYTADGERNIKLTSPRLNMHQNASQFNNPPLFIPTLYASPLITLTPKGYTKHYFEEGRRVCSKLGGWFLWRVPADDIRKPVEEVKDNYEEQHNQQRQGVHETFGKCIGAWPELIDKYDLLKMLLKYKEEEKNFYYHSDHLGSAAHLTSGGDVTQTLNHLPYGEDWIDVQNYAETRYPRLGIYTYNGKEKDYESSFQYYGARYYWSELLTGWISVDLMMDKYPGMSPYNYCVWNPIKLVDANGMDTLVFNKYGNYSHTIQAKGEHVGRYDQPSGTSYVFNFADPENDPISIEKREITKLQVVKECDIRIMLFNAGVFRDENRDNKFGYAKEEGLGLGKLDFSHKAEGGMTSMYGSDTYRSLYLVDGIAHNPDNFGNFLFGAAGNALGIPLVFLKIGAHWNSLTHPKENGYSSQWDSGDDQFSIKCGFMHAKQNRYNSIKDQRSTR